MWARQLFKYILFFFELQMLLISSRLFGERDMDYFSCNKNIIHHLISPIRSMFVGQVWRRVEYNRMWLAFLILYDNDIGWFSHLLKYLAKLRLHCEHINYVKPSRPDPGRIKKINLNCYYPTSLRDLKKVLWKPFRLS